jgi:hypothetical protein
VCEFAFEQFARNAGAVATGPFSRRWQNYAVPGAYPGTYDSIPPQQWRSHNEQTTHPDQAAKDGARRVAVDDYRKPRFCGMDLGWSDHTAVGGRHARQ